MTDTASRRHCPNCNALVPPNRTQCGMCKLEVAKMDAFAAAKQAAQRRGVRRTEVETEPTPAWRRPTTLVAVGLLALLGVWGYSVLTKPTPPAYLKYPASREEAAQAFINHIATGDSEEYDKSYALIAPSARDPDDSDERGHYRGLFHAIYKYLTGEFGDGWEKTATFAPDPNDPDLMITRVGLETLHIRVAQQTPPEQRAAAGPHYAVTGIDEFNIRQAAGFQQMEAIMGVVGGVAGQGAIDNLQTIIGARESQRLTPMQRKVKLLPIVRDPRTTTRQVIIRLWPVRQDPVVRARLEAIGNDDRYAPVMKQTAKAVLTETVPEEELIAVGVE